MAIFSPTDFTITTIAGQRFISLAGGGGTALTWYNVRDYGALGDDSTDDYAAFIAARNAIWAAGVAAVLYIPPGIYRSSNFIQLQSQANRPPIYVMGEWCVLRSTTDTSFFYRKWDDSGDFTEVVQLVIDGCFFLPTVSGNSTGVHTVDSWGTIVRRCHFKNLKIGMHVQAVNSWNEGWVSDDNIFDNCTDGFNFNNAGGTGSFQSGRMLNTVIRVLAGQTGIKIVSGANLYGSHFEFNIWPGGNNAIGIDIDGNIDSCKFVGIVDNAGSGGTPLFGVRFGTNASNTNKAQFSISFAGATYNGGDAQENAVKNAFSKTWYYDPLPYGSRLYPRFTLLTTTGDTPYASAANVWARRAIGSAGDISKVSGGVPVWAAPAALTKVDDTNVTATLGGGATTALVNAASITLGWTGTLAVSRGGLGVGTLASNGVLYGNGTGAVQALAVNATATNKYLRQVSSGAPSWETIPASEITSGAALTKVDDTNVTLALGGTPASALLAAVSLTLSWAGQLGLARGGTHADLSATGGAGKYLKQASAGADITVASITAAEITSGAALTKVDDTNVTATLGGTPTTALLVAASITLGWTGTLAQSRGGTGSATPFANPSASVGLAAVNGSATTFMRSDAAPALSQSITPTWTGLHIWSSASVRISDTLRLGSTSAPTVTTAGWMTLEGLRLPDGALTDARVYRAEITSAFAPAVIPGVGTPRINRAISLEVTSSPVTNAISIDRSSTGFYVRHDVTVNGNSNSVSGSYSALAFELNRSTGGTGGLSEMYGIKGDTQFNIASTLVNMTGIYSIQGFDAGTVSNGRGLYLIQSIDGGTATNVTGVDIQQGQSTGSVTTRIGVKIAAWTGTAPTTDIAIQSLGGENRFVGSVVIGANAAPTASIGLDVQGKRVRFDPTSTLTGSLDSGVIVTGTITNNTTANIVGLHVGLTFDGNATDPIGFLSRCTFSPSANIADAQGGYINAIGNPPSGKTITNMYGHRSQTASLGGLGAITNAVSIYADSFIAAGVTPTNTVNLKINTATGGTNNYDMQFVTVDLTAGGTYYSRVPVLVNGLKKYAHLFNA